MPNRLKPEYLPTPRQIARECAEIRQRWSASERRRRTVNYAAVQAESSWAPPQINLASCVTRVRRAVSEAVG